MSLENEVNWFEFQIYKGQRAFYKTSMQNIRQGFLNSTPMIVVLLLTVSGLAVKNSGTRVPCTWQHPILIIYFQFSLYYVHWETLDSNGS